MLITRISFGCGSSGHSGRPGGGASTESRRFTCAQQYTRGSRVSAADGSQIAACFPPQSVFNDQVRIVNPGALPRTRVKPSDRDHLLGRFSRNPHLMLLLEKLGLSRQKGLGLAKVRSLASQLGCRLGIVDHDDSFEAKLIVDPDCAVRVQQFGAVSAPSRKRMRPEERYARIIEALGTDEMSAQALAAALQWPTPTVRAALKAMVKKKLVNRCSMSARSPRQRYRAR